jgi:hypothetical protein
MCVSVTEGAGFWGGGWHVRCTRACRQQQMAAGGLVLHSRSVRCASLHRTARPVKYPVTHTGGCHGR